MLRNVVCGAGNPTLRLARWTGIIDASTPSRSYFIAQDSVVKMTAADGHGERCGVEVIEPGGKVIFIVEKYFADFKAACAIYFQQLIEQMDADSLEGFDTATRGKWFSG